MRMTSAIRQGMFGLCVILCLLTSTTLHSQEKPVPATGQTALTVCDVLAHPSRFRGKLVKLRGKISLNFENFTLSDVSASCHEGIWLDYPEDVPEVGKGTGSIRLIQNAELKKFKEVVSARSPDAPGHTCNLGPCQRYKVVATIAGRFDYKNAKCATKKNESPFGCGYGNMGTWNARLIIGSVSDVSATEVK